MAQEYTEDGVWLLQTQNVQEFFLSEASQTRINTEFHHYLDKSKVRKGDILIARRGSFGKASIYLEDEEINSADIIIIRCIEKRVNPFYLVAFLNCTFGTNQLLRYASGGVQGHVNLTILENLKICNLDADFQKRIESICKQSYLAKQQGEQLYSQAQTLLLSELGPYRLGSPTQPDLRQKLRRHSAGRSHRRGVLSAQIRRYCRCDREISRRLGYAGAVGLDQKVCGGGE